MKFALLLKLICFIFMLGAGFSKAQNQVVDCNNFVSRAADEYENNTYDVAIQRILHCIKNGDKLNRKDGYRILALCYLKKGATDSAEYAVKQLLLIDPYYQKTPYTSSKEFTDMLARFSTYPKVEAGIRVGINKSLPKIKTTNPQGSDSLKSSITGNTKTGGFIAGEIGYNFKNPNFQIRATGGAGLLLFTESTTYGQAPQTLLTYSEDLNIYEYGLIVKYAQSLGKLNPVLKKTRIYAGLGLSKTVIHSGFINFNFVDPAAVKRERFSINLNDSNPSLNLKQLNLSLDVGISMFLLRGQFSLGMQYNVTSSKHYQNTIPQNIQAEKESVDYWVPHQTYLNYINLYMSYSLPILWQSYQIKKSTP